MSVKRYLAGLFALLLMVSGGEARAADDKCITQPGNAAAGADKCVAQDDCTFEDGVSCQTFDCASGASVPCCAAEGADYMWCDVPGIGPIDVNLPPEPAPVLVPDDLGDPDGYGIEASDWWWWGYLKEAREAAAACMLPEGADVPLSDATCTATDVCWGPASMKCQEIACEGSEDQVCCYTGGDTVDCAPVSSPEGMLPYLLPGAPESPLGEPTPEPDDEGGSWWDDLTQWWGDLWHRTCRDGAGDLPPWWGDVCGEPIPPVSPDLPPLTEDDGEEPPLPPSGCWTTPSGERLCPGEDGREATLAQVRDFFEDLGMYDTEDGADDPTPTMDDPSEFVEHNPLGTEYRSAPTIEVPPLVWHEPAQPPTPEPTPEGTPTAAPVDATPEPLTCPPGTTPAFGGVLCLGWWVPGSDWRVDWSIKPDLSPEAQACTVETIDQPVSVETPDGGSAAYLGGCEVVTCPGDEPVATCCTGSSLSGQVTCQQLVEGTVLHPYDPPPFLGGVLEWLAGLEGSGDVPAGYEGPWRYYLFSSASEGR